ncbi:MAG: hypothetical protein A2Z91_00985 [Deltaproteobacteria bacterium GWA2_38_16]|nr:MAG: hypothetical protein A2Z91_00985 [Deltaproteobacteria bacterium GWA2_38_16]OGQ02983.1 MAG: hypothetical protein A3D19_01045 [Deltaproteobacteria bacterium RIFCSPHIGHO2_02_FULL_38_15]OGQ34524.1 MAG: hypothetical protein A3A72_05185 [Deltaproteobacteria bacterium RIFCSPLOWO2_01_FULL_38_9]OGQ59226.1 MAG: hypothetical protein A3G92_06920 [Deltaproteobacteria bacterium RIFCSPLOWO2_12_FULL_38_8]HBQ21916.1 hypothetical protein [Deltaproteobacteria bacterium]
MSAIKRNIEEALLKDLNKKFVFLAGPRQVGKTTLANEIMKQLKGIRLSYDDDDDRPKILKREYVHESWVCLDEFHKFKRWKQHIKGVYDKYHETLHVLLTGSARLDVFQKSGDSLFGRYYLYHLHPLTCGELSSSFMVPLLSDIHQLAPKAAGIPELLTFGGFPEPFKSQSAQEHLRWSNMRRALLVREELRELTHIQLISLIEQLLLLLPDRIGSLFSYNALSEDIRVSPPTIQTWMNMFQSLYIVFKILPYSKKIHRAIQKQPKFYFYDWSQIQDESARFENFIASHLWKAIQLWNDLGEANLSLNFIRDRDRREVDFLITKDQKPWFLIEAKLAETSLSESLIHFSNSLGIPGIQLILKSDIYKKQGNLSLISADRWLLHLP